MKKLSLLLVLALSMGACSTKDEGGDDAATTAFKNSVKGNTYVITDGGVVFLKAEAMKLTVTTGTEYTVAADASFVIAGMTFTFAEGTIFDNHAYYSFNKAGTKYIKAVISTTDASMSFTIPSDSVAGNNAGSTQIATKK